jgi:homoserine dehydrogenase
VRDVRVCLLGFGHVARAWCQLTSDRSAELADRHGLELRITAVGTARHGSLVSAAGVTPAELLAMVSGGDHSFPEPVRPGADLIAGSEADVLVEATPLEAGGHAAIAHLEAAFASGMDVVTVNKGPIAWAYRQVRDAADRAGRRLRFEGVTMDGCPVYNLVERCLPGAAVLGFHGVLNATTNYVLDEMTDGLDLTAAVAAAQQAGFAEADPGDDLDGSDAAAKVAALANVLMGADITPDQVPRDSIRHLSRDRVAAARKDGKRLRVACSARRDPTGALAVGVALVEVGPDHPYYAVTASSSVLVLQTDLMGDIEIVERDGLLPQTAYAIYADLLTLYGPR